MDSISIRTTIIIKFAIYQHQPNLVQQQEEQRILTSPETTHTNAGKVCAVCGSQLHMTST